MVGRTPREVAEIARRSIQEVMQVQTQPQQPPVVAPAPPQAVSGEPDPDLLISNPSEYHRQMRAFSEQQTQSQLRAYAQPFVTGLTEQARFSSQQDDRFKDVWRKYAPEIEALIAANTQHMPEARAQKQLWDQAAEIVQGRHYRELASDLARQQPGASMATERPGNFTSAPASMPSDPLDELWQSDSAWVQYAKENQMSREMIRDYCKRRQISVSDYVAQIKANTIVRDGPNRYLTNVGEHFGGAR